MALHLTRLLGRAALASTAVLLLGAAAADAATQKLRWRHPDVASVDGFRVHLGRSPGTYRTSIDVGVPPPDANGIFSAVVPLGSNDRVVAVSAYNRHGSSLSNERPLDVPDQPAGGGGGAGSGSSPNSSLKGAPLFVVHGDGGALLLEAFDVNATSLGVFPMTVPPTGSHDSVFDVRPASCEVDGDGVADLVLGFGYGSGGGVEVRRGISGDFAHRAWLAVDWAAYNQMDGATWPACGDVDGDGRDEIVVGLTGPDAGGWIQIFDDATRGFAPMRRTPYSDGWLQVTWLGYQGTGGVTHPAVGDVDGDGRDEIVVGLGEGGQGWLQIFDDSRAGFAPFDTPHENGWIQVSWGAYNAANGTTHPAAGDLDGDGRDEIVVGLGVGGGGWVQVFDDAAWDFVPLASAYGSGWAQVEWESYNAMDGTVVPSIADLNDDGVPEVLAGLSDQGDGWYGGFSSASFPSPELNLMFLGWGEQVQVPGARSVLAR